MPVAIIIDTETNGLVSKKSGQTTQFLLQISAISVDICTLTVTDQFDTYVRMSEPYVLNQFNITETHMTYEMINGGMSCKKALTRLSAMCEKADVVVGHNISYDVGVIEHEIKRLNMTQQLFDKKTVYCTMRSSTAVCKLPCKTSNKFKVPKLCELYAHYFPNSCTTLQYHNSMVDVLVCLRCFLALKYGVIIDELVFEIMVNTQNNSGLVVGVPNKLTASEFKPSIESMWTKIVTVKKTDDYVVVEVPPLLPPKPTHLLNMFLPPPLPPKPAHLMKHTEVSLPIIEVYNECTDDECTKKECTVKEPMPEMPKIPLSNKTKMKITPSLKTELIQAQLDTIKNTDMSILTLNKPFFGRFAYTEQPTSV